MVFFFQAEDGIRDLVRSRGLGDVYKRQDDIKSILNSAITKYQELSGNLLNENRNADFFGLLSEDIKEKKGIKILPDYLYKQLYIKLKSWRESEVGYSLDTLNGLCQYVFEKDYFDTFETAPEDEAIPEFPWLSLIHISEPTRPY